MATTISIRGVDVTAWVRFGSATMKLNSFDFGLVSPNDAGDPLPLVPALGDTVSVTQPTWSGELVKASQAQAERGATVFWAIGSTNTNDAPGGSAPFDIDTDAPDGVTTIGCKGLTYSKSRDAKADKEQGGCTVFVPGFWPGMSVSVTASSLGLLAHAMEVADVSVSWPTGADGAPATQLQLGAPLATLTQLIQDQNPYVDQTPPTLPADLVLSSSNAIAPDGSMWAVLYATWGASPEPEVIAYELSVDADTDGDGVLSWAQPQAYRTTTTSILIPGVLGGTLYGVKVRAINKYGIASAFTDVATVVTAADPSAPEVPVGLAAIPGYRLLGVTWSRNGEPDLEHYEVRYSADGSSWVSIDTRNSAIVLGGLDPTQTYQVQVRAVDRSGQVRTSDVDDTPVLAVVAAEAGWSDAVSAQPLLVGASDLAVSTAVVDFLTSFHADVSILTAGTLKIGGLPNTPDVLEVYDAGGNLMGRWSADGLLIIDPSTPARRVLFAAGSLTFSDDGGLTWGTAIDADGIHADAITMGTAPGGHNAIPNASFELSAFATRLTKVWTSAADWGTLLTGGVNVNTAGTELNLTTI